MKLRAFMLSVGAAALLTGAAAAQDTTTGTVGTTGLDGTTGTAAPAPEFTTIEEMTVGDMIGMNVLDPQGSTIGEIDYVVPSGDGALAVIGIGGFLGIGEYTVALPLEDFRLDAAQRVLTLDTDKETLKTQPEFDESGAQSLPDETRLADLIASAAQGDGSRDTGTTTGTGAVKDGTVIQ